MIIGTSDGGAHLARDDGADWSSYFLRSWVLDREVWTLEEGIRQITQVPAALLGFVDRGVIAPGRARRPDGLRPRDRSARGRRSSCTTSRAASAASRPGAGACSATIVNGEPIVLDGELTGRLPGRVVRPGVARTGRPRDLRTRSHAVGVRRRRPRDRAAARVGRAPAGRVPGVRATRAAGGRPLPLRVRRPRRVPDRGRAARRWRHRARPHISPTTRSHVRGGTEPGPRLDDMAVDRIAAAALYPTFGLMIQGVTEREPALALCRALNDWVAEYCSHDPEHLLGIATLPMTDAERRARGGAPRRRGARLPRRVAAPRALRRAPPPAGRRVRAAVVVPRGGGRAVRHPPGHERPRPVDELQSRFDDYYTPLHAAHFVTEQMLALTTFVAYGILERHPRLRVAFLETGAVWAMSYVHRLDEHFELFGFDRGGLTHASRPTTSGGSASCRSRRSSRASPRWSPSTRRRSCSRPTTRTPTAPSPAPPPASSRPPSSTTTPCAASCATTRHRLYGLERSTRDRGDGRVRGHRRPPRHPGLRGPAHPDDVLARILTAATRACSSGNTQPWELVVVVRPRREAAAQDDAGRRVRRRRRAAGAAPRTARRRRRPPGHRARGDRARRRRRRDRVRVLEPRPRDPHAGRVRGEPRRHVAGDAADSRAAAARACSRRART